MKQIRIVLAGLMWCTNLGENILTRCLEEDIRREFGTRGDEEVQIEYLDFYGRTENADLRSAVPCGKVRAFCLKSFRYVCRRLKKPAYYGYVEWVFHPKNKKFLEAYYRSIMKGASLIVFPGGGIIECSDQHDYYYQIDLITRIAEEIHIPVCFNAVGNVVDKRQRFGWGIMKRAVNRSCVKSMTCRDGVEWINRNLYGGRAFATELPCSAILSAQTYRVQKDPESNTIGIGVIRGNVFTSYGNPMTRDQMLDMYEELVRGVLAMGYSCCIFTNGTMVDVQFGQRLANRLGSMEGVSYALQPHSSEELVRTIASFKALITARLHSVIVAYSLNIPAAAISWMGKVPDFMKLVGTPEYAVPLEKLGAEALISTLQQAMRKGYPLEIRRTWEEKIHASTAKMLSYIEMA